MRKNFYIAILSALILCLCVLCCAHAAVSQVLELPESTKVIEAEAFYGDTSIREVVLPEGVETIGAKAFAGSGVTKVNLPETLTYIAPDAFDGCDGVTLTVVAGTPGEEFAITANLTYEYAGQATPAEYFTYTIANGECTISGYSGSASTVIVPAQIEGYPVTVIGNNAFLYSNCSEIRLPDGIQSIGDNAFSFCQKLTTINIPQSVTSIGESAFRASHNLIEIILPNGLETIGSRAFGGCSSLISIVIPNSVTSIGKSAFQECSSLTSVVLSNKLTVISEYLFYECHSLNNVVIPRGIQTIGICAFFECTNLSNLSLPNSLIHIENNAFAFCVSLDNLYLPNYIESIDYSAFRGCTGLTKCILPDGITTISDSCFLGCTNLNSLYIPKNVDEIYLTAFGTRSYVVGQGWIFTPSVSDTFTIYGESGSYAETFAIENKIPFGTRMPITIPTPSDDALPTDYYELVNTYFCSGSLYFEANLIKDCNGVLIPDPDYSVYFFFLDSKGCVVTDPAVLSKLYTIYMYVHNEKLLNRSITSLNDAAKIWSASALDFMSKKAIWSHAGGLAGDLVATYASGGLNFVGVLTTIGNNIWSNVKEANELGSWLEILFVQKLLGHLDQLATIAGSMPVKNGYGAYDFDSVQAKLAVYTHFKNTYKAVNSICIPVNDEIIEKFKSDTEVSMYFVANALMEAVDDIVDDIPFASVSLTMFRQIINGDQDELDVASDVIGLIDEFAGIDLSDCGDLYDRLGNIGDVFETVLGISQATALKDENWLKPFYMTVDELKTTQLYKNHLLLAQ